MQIETTTPPGVMQPIGPYSHIAQAGPFVSISATAGVDPATGEMAGPDVYSQAQQILKSFRVLLDSIGLNLRQVMHVNVYLLDMANYEQMNRAYAEAFGDHQPARTVVAVSALPKNSALLTMNLNAIDCRRLGQFSPGQ